MLSFMERMVEAATFEDAWSLHCDQMAKYGFDRLLYGFTRFRVLPTGFADREDFVVLSNHDSKYLQEFLDRRLYHDAPMIRWAHENDGACPWSWITEHMTALTPAERKVVEFNRAHGVTAGVSISFRTGIWQSKGSIGLVAPRGTPQSDVDALWAERGREIHVLNCLMHLKLMNLPDTTSAGTLTPRQREVLEWVGQGKTMQDIAMIMDLTPATVEKHLRLARDALGVETTAQAVLKASFKSQIYVVQPEEKSYSNGAPNDRQMAQSGRVRKS